MGMKEANSLRRRLAQAATRLSAPERPGREERNAALSAPTEVPTRRSGVMPASKSATTAPACIGPRLPPPESAKATVIGSALGLHVDRMARVGRRRRVKDDERSRPTVEEFGRDGAMGDAPDGAVPSAGHHDRVTL